MSDEINSLFDHSDHSDTASGVRHGPPGARGGLRGNDRHAPRDGSPGPAVRQCGPPSAASLPPSLARSVRLSVSLSLCLSLASRLAFSLCSLSLSLARCLSRSLPIVRLASLPHEAQVPARQSRRAGRSSSRPDHSRDRPPPSMLWLSPTLSPPNSLVQVGRWIQGVTGYDLILCNCVATFANGKPTGQLPGRVVKNPKATGASRTGCAARSRQGRPVGGGRSGH